jgi:hypothetical protein
MSVRSSVFGICLIACSLVAGLIAQMYLRPYLTTPGVRSATPPQRQALYEMLQPVTLRNCQLERFGEDHDGGYLMCRNLLEDVESGYSYGIGGYDKWGCDISTKRRVTVHQYDCFDLAQPACPAGTTAFHPECVADARRIEEGRVFETIAGQIAANGDTAKRLVMKWTSKEPSGSHSSLRRDQVLEQIDQLASSFTDRGRHVSGARASAEAVLRSRPPSHQQRELHRRDGAIPRLGIRGVVRQQAPCRSRRVGPTRRTQRTRCTESLFLSRLPAIAAGIRADLRCRIRASLMTDPWLGAAT